MKKCTYCGHENMDEASRCEHCYAGFPNDKQEKKLEKETEQNPVRSPRKK